MLDQKNSLVKTTDFKIEIQTRDKLHFVLLSRIIYFKAENDGTRIIVEDNQSLWTDSPLKYFVNNLEEKSVVKIHRNIAVNLIHIEWINYATLKMDNYRKEET